ncbi:hypothetical protein [Acidocella sp. KAb 2-4]|uniref:hypothetical protein n=1 Tax=Acidocella sp. KAb 2-4 TaxID=2885158 RepID=UPI001D08FC42|nr:hypothetical protein [Acidocella sp. KAb 2-4]MCB5944254.1 hypothetical protein [Acidocella sp. KAb 2-4]
MIWYIVAVLHVVSSGAVAEIDYYQTKGYGDCEQQIAMTGPTVSYTMHDGTPVQIVSTCESFSPAAAAKLPPSVEYFVP